MGHDSRHTGHRARGKALNIYQGVIERKLCLLAAQGRHFSPVFKAVSAFRSHWARNTSPPQAAWA
eukprot:955915-Prymnesium_polylepis.1